MDTYGATILDPISRQRISADQFGKPVKAAILDLDSRTQNIESLSILVAPLITAVSGTPASSTIGTETMDVLFGYYTFVSLAGVRYRISCLGRGLSASAIPARYSAKFRYNIGLTTPANPTSGSAQVSNHDHAYAAAIAGGGGITTQNISATFVPGAGIVVVGMSWTLVSGSGTGTPSGGAEMFAEATGFA